MSAHGMDRALAGVQLPPSPNLGTDVPRALQLLADAYRLLSLQGEPSTVSPEPASGLFPASPRWDPARRTLFCADRVIKRLRLPAENQELIVTAFEEDGWPPRI